MTSSSIEVGTSAISLSAKRIRKKCPISDLTTFPYACKLSLYPGELLRKTLQIDSTCPCCKGPLRLIALIKTEDTIKKILAAMGLPTEAPKPYPARPPPSEPGDAAEYLN